MSCIHYKFSSKLEYNTVTFDGLHITLTELKKQIMARERLKATDCDLQITNAQTREEYLDDEVHIPKHSSVIVRRTPIGGVKPAGRTFIVDRSETAVMGSSRPTDSSPSMSLAQLTKTANLVDANASEEDKIKAMMSQSNHEYDPIHYSKKAIGPPPANYTCYRCGKAGHYIRNCTLQSTQDKVVESLKPVKTSKGIPQSFMVKAEPGTKGAMLTMTGEYAIPAIDAQAYAQGKKERPPFVPHEQSSSEEEIDPIPDELLCPICTDLMIDAVVIPCCGNSYCDECIRTALLDSEDHVCFTCKQSDVSPDNLIANKFLRQAVNSYKNESGALLHRRAQVHHPALPPPRPQLSRLLHSRQLDPLKVNVPQTSSPKPASSTPPITVTTTSSPAQSPNTSSTPVAPPTADPPTPPPDALEEGQDASPDPPVDQNSPVLSSSQGELLPHGDSNPKPVVQPESSGPSGRSSQSYSLPILNHLPSMKPPFSSVHQSRPNHSQRGGGGGRHWYRNRGEHLSSRLQPVQPPAPVPPLYPSPVLYGPPPQPYLPPYTSGPGLIPPPIISYQPQPVYASGHPVLNPPWGAPGSQPPLVRLPLPLPQPSISKEDFYKPRHHRMEKATSKLDEFTKDFHKELMKYRNAPKRRRPSYSRSRSFSRSPFSRSPYTRSRTRSRSRSYSYSVSRSRSRSHGRSYPRSPFSRRNGRSYGRSRTRSRSRSRSYAYRRSGSPQSPFPYRGGGWEGSEVAGPYRSRSRSRSPGGYRARSPGGRKPPPRELPPYELKGQSPGSQDRWDRERYRQWEKEYADWYNKYYKDYDNQQSSMHHKGHSSRDKERDRMSPLPRNYSVHERARRRDDRADRGDKTDRRAVPPPPPSSSSSTTKSSNKILKTKKLKKRKADEPESSQQSMNRGDATPVRDEPMDELPSQNKKSSSASKASGNTAASKAAPSKSSATAAKTSTKSVSKAQSDKAKKEKSSKGKTKAKVDGLKLKNDKMKKKTGETFNTKKESSSSSAAATKSLKPNKHKSEDAPNSTTPRKEKNSISSARHSRVKTPPLAAHSLPPPHPPLHDGSRTGQDTRVRRDYPQGGGFHSLPPSNQHGLQLVHHPPSPAESRRRMGEESRTSRGLPPGKLRRVDGSVMESEANSHSQAPNHPHFHRVPPSDRPGNPPLPGSRELNRSDPNRIPIEALMNIEVKPLRRIKLNRDLGGRGSTESTSERPTSGSEKISSTSDRSPANMSEGDHRTAEGAGGKERSSSTERGKSRERPSSAGEKTHGPEREQDRTIAKDRERGRPSRSDRARDRGLGLDSERDRVSGSTLTAVIKLANTADRETEREKSRMERKTSTGQSGSARSVCLDRMTIAEKSEISKTQDNHHEKQKTSSKDRGEGSERSAQFDRSVSKDRTERSVSSGEKSASAHREGKDNQEVSVKCKPRISRKVLTSHFITSGRSTQKTKPDLEKDQGSVSSITAEQPSSSPVTRLVCNQRVSAAPSEVREEPLIQPPPRSKWEREDDEDGLEDEPCAPKEAFPVVPQTIVKEALLEAQKPMKSESRETPKDERRGTTKEEKKARVPREESKTGRTTQANSDKTTKTKTGKERKAVKEEGRASARENDRKGGGREDNRGAAGKEERIAESRSGGEREEVRGPEPRRQRLASDLGRETDEAAFVPDYSEGEGSEQERGGSNSLTPTLSRATHSPTLSNHSGSANTTAEKKKKKKSKRSKKHKKHKKHSSQDKEAPHKEHKQKHKKKKSKKSKDKDVDEENKKEKAE
ncbi:E3 ubiquitin-protein ligase RBBP6-like isoform X1 [Gouania willdenowi]|uniref:E3 ubiquitin-protein ligase RBBP6-like n=1 Tax=Gouania willdenowi TaxID=441366 RepID=A0A8C5DWY3_GOUWI|nr:E3 ubiquitin-protein ligase RBBP6-like isoform X1 [Gouania willdenowi]